MQANVSLLDEVQMPMVKPIRPGMTDEAWTVEYNEIQRQKAKFREAQCNRKRPVKYAKFEDVLKARWREWSR